MAERMSFVNTQPEKGPVSITRPHTTGRATCWSITINNYSEEDIRVNVPGWRLFGQPEIGENGTRHFQGMLTTPQVRFSQVKRNFPRAHIEPARDKSALAKYVQKEDTRAGDFVTTGIPTIWEYQAIVANEWHHSEFERRTNDDVYARQYGYDCGTIALVYVDEICTRLIEGGSRGLEFVAINPMWRSSWKKFYASIIKRHGRREKVHFQQPEAGEHEA